MEYNQRAMQAALELSMQNLNNTSYSSSSPVPFGLLENETPIQSSIMKSQNITLCVSVPSSEHVAEIVGKQGCRIKALRAKTNTYIKTPTRTEQPKFIITGRPEDVSVAKREILSAAEHLTQVRLKRISGPSHVPAYSGQNSDEKVTVRVKVPYRVVGLVVGPKGSTVRRIQQTTKTYIVTPSRDEDPAFEVRGLPENVEKARAKIESYIANRTSGGADSPDTSDSDISGYGTEPPMATTKEPDYQLSPMVNAVFYGAQDQNEFLPINSAPMSHGDGAFNFSAFSDALMYIDQSLPRPNPVRMRHPDLSLLDNDPPSPTYSYDSGSSDGYTTASPKLMPTTSLGVCVVCRNEESTSTLVPCGHNAFCSSCASYISDYAHKCPICCMQVLKAIHFQFM